SQTVTAPPLGRPVSSQSTPPAAMVLPSGLNASSYSQTALDPNRLASVLSLTPQMRTSFSVVLPSILVTMAATDLPSGANATPLERPSFRSVRTSLPVLA